MSVLKEFREFINKGNVVDLAVAVVIGGAFGKIVSALVADLVMPLVNSVMPQGDWRKWEVTPLHFRIGDFLGTVVDFTIVAFVVFIVMVKLVGKVNKKATATRTCPECLESVPVGAKRCRACTSVLTGIAILLMLAAPSSASAQTNPAFVFAKPEEVKVGAPPPLPVEWKAQVKTGTTATSGNSQTVNATAGVSVSRKQNANKFAFDAAAAYGESNIIVPVFGDALAPTTITSLERRSTTTNNNWFSKARYDRFLTTNNAGYASGQVGGDRIAGKSLIGGGQTGYSRQLLKNEHAHAGREIGYDFSYEHYLPQPIRTLDPGQHPLGAPVRGRDDEAHRRDQRAHRQRRGPLQPQSETAAINAQNRTAGVEPVPRHPAHRQGEPHHHALQRLSFGFGFTVRFDQNPAPRPIPSGSPAGSMYSADFPFANRTDTLGELTLVYTFI